MEFFNIICLFLLISLEYATEVRSVLIKSCGPSFDGNEISGKVFGSQAEPIDPLEVHNSLKQLSELHEDHDFEEKERAQLISQFSNAINKYACNSVRFLRFEDQIEQCNKSNSSNVVRYLVHYRRKLFDVCKSEISDRLAAITAKFNKEDKESSKVVLECANKATSQSLSGGQLDGYEATECIEKASGSHEAAKKVCKRVDGAIGKELPLLEKILSIEEFAKQVDGQTINWFKIGIACRGYPEVRESLRSKIFKLEPEELGKMMSKKIEDLNAGVSLYKRMKRLFQ